MRLGHDTPGTLALRELSITYNPGRWNERLAVDRATLTVQDGDFLLLTGSNGSGKSTLLRLLSGDLDNVHVQGSLDLNGRSLAAMPLGERARMVTLIDQDPTLGTCDHLLVAEMLTLVGRPVSQRVVQRMTASHSTIELGQRIQSLSGGQRQLLSALIAIERQPILLLADEPTAALDAQFAPLVMNLLLERLAQPGMMTIVVSHHGLAGAEAHGIRTAHIEGGHLTE